MPDDWATQFTTDALTRVGFYDLEMCRVGCASMQLGAALGLFVDSGKAGWEPFCEGWERETNKALGYDDLCAAAAVQHLICWREISRYLSYDGTPGMGYAWASPADPTRYRTHIKTVERMLGVER